MTPARIWPVLAISGVVGGVCGVGLGATWQDVIEPAQVLAGVVQYQPGDPLLLYSTRTWTLLHQVTALAISAGVTEWWLTIIWSGLVGALAFQALALTTLAMGASPLVAMLTPVLLWASGAASVSGNYPVRLLGFPHTYGLVAHPLLLLVVGLLAVRRDRAAAFLLGLFPAIHIVVGLWAWLIVGASGIQFRWHWAERARPVARWWLAGVVFAVVSAVVHVTWFVGTTPPATEYTDAMMRGVLQYWESHRTPIEWFSTEPLRIILLPLALVLYQRWLGARVPIEARILARSFAIVVVIVCVADWIVRLVPEHLGWMVARVMPRRLLALPALGGMAWIIGVATSSRVPAAVRFVSQVAFASIALVVLPLVADPSGVGAALLQWGATVFENWTVVAAVVVATGVAALLVGSLASVRWQQWSAGWPDRISRQVFVALLAALAIAATVQAVASARSILNAVKDSHSDPVFAAVAARPGLLLTTWDLHLIQAPTRRPILIDVAALDGLIYVPAAADRSDHILRQIYGMALGEPPESHEVLWGRRSVTEWQAIADEFHVTDVLTPASWVLQLPQVVRNGELVLWSIPVR